MHEANRRKAALCRVLRQAAAALLVLILGVLVPSSLVMATTVTAVVVDGDETYTFSMRSSLLGDILDRAEELGLPQIGPLDKVERVENTTTVNVLRGVPVRLMQTGAASESVFTAYLGTTVEKALADNNILLRDADEVTPGRDTPVTAGMTVTLSRASAVTVTADGESRQVSLVGATVADALQSAGVALEEKDSVNYGLSEPLFDKMLIQVRRALHIAVTADGHTETYVTSGGTVAEALKNCGIVLGDKDRLSVPASSALTDGMEIVVRRVEVREVTETEEVEYPVRYVDDETLYTGETETRTEGVNGSREVTYRVTYVDGVEESREEASSTVTKEPEEAVVARGTRQRPSADLSESPDGTLVDASGNPISYSRRLVGTCTAYYPFSPTTSTGMAAGRGVIAVNPNVIPYGTRMYVVSPDGSIVYGYGVAGDTGGACMSGDILADLCFDTEAECAIIGRRQMVIYILN